MGACTTGATTGFSPLNSLSTTVNCRPTTRSSPPSTETRETASAPNATARGRGDRERPCGRLSLTRLARWEAGARGVGTRVSPISCRLRGWPCCRCGRLVWLLLRLRCRVPWRKAKRVDGHRGDTPGQGWAQAGNAFVSLPTPLSWSCHDSDTQSTHPRASLSLTHRAGRLPHCAVVTLRRAHRRGRRVAS